MDWQNLWARAGGYVLRQRIRFAGNEGRARLLRRRGVQIGEDCLLISTDLGGEPFLVSLGDHVVISAGVQFLTHDAATWAIGEKRPGTLFARIKVGSWCFIGQGSILLPGTTIGDHCVIGAGSVVKGEIPAGSVAYGSPARISKTIDDYAAGAWARYLPIDWAEPLRPQLEQMLPRE